MGEAEDLAKDVDSRLRQHAKRERRIFTEGYFPSAAEILGVEADDLRKVVREFRTRFRALAPRQAIAAAEALVAMGTLETRQAAYELLATHVQAKADLKLGDIEALGEGIDNWASVDGFGCWVSGPAWRAGNISDHAIRRWARSEDRWWRRAALVSTVPLNLKSRGGTGDAKRTLMVCEILVSDHDEMVVKALSWALRQLVPWDRDAVRTFVERHRSDLAARVRREVRNKLETGLKNPHGRRKMPQGH
jgi:3-methyladenine DNA glycosylase AlkD